MTIKNFLFASNLPNIYSVMQRFKLEMYKFFAHFLFLSALTLKQIIMVKTYSKMTLYSCFRHDTVF
jgi:hypothetical protein